jgi:transposase
LLAPAEKLTPEQAGTVAAMQAAVPTVPTATTLVRELFQLVRDRQPEPLESWTKRVAESGIRPLSGFATGLRRDWEAVLAGLTLPWSNGLVEGQVNRLKLLKRQMYGRAGFALLRARVLRPG